MTSSFLKGLVTDYGKLGYQLWHRPLKMASLVYEREISGGTTVPRKKRDYDTGNKKLTGNLNGTLVANVCLFEFYNF